MENSNTNGASIDGRWHLIAADYPEGKVPDHRVDFVFHNEPTGLRGAILSRIDDREMPLTSIIFDGSELRLKMSVAPISPNPESPYLVMRAIADHFVGRWDTPEAKGVLLKLIRARDTSNGA